MSNYISYENKQIVNQFEYVYFDINRRFSDIDLDLIPNKYKYTNPILCFYFKNDIVYDFNFILQNIEKISLFNNDQEAPIEQIIDINWLTSLNLFNLQSYFAPGVIFVPLPFFNLNGYNSLIISENQSYRIKICLKNRSWIYNENDCPIIKLRFTRLVNDSNNPILNSSIHKWLYNGGELIRCKSDLNSVFNKNQFIPVDKYIIPRNSKLKFNGFNKIISHLYIYFQNLDDSMNLQKIFDNIELIYKSDAGTDCVVYQSDYHNLCYDKFIHKSNTYIIPLTLDPLLSPKLSGLDFNKTEFVLSINFNDASPKEINAHIFGLYFDQC